MNIFILLIVTVQILTLYISLCRYYRCLVWPYFCSYAYWLFFFTSKNYSPSHSSLYTCIFLTSTCCANNAFQVAWIIHLKNFVPVGTTSRLYYSSCIGCPSHDGSSSRLPVLCISRCLVGHRRIWLLTFNWLSIVVAKIFVLPLTRHASYHGPTTLSVTGVFLSLDLVCGTVYLQIRLEMQFRAFKRQLKTVLFSR